MDRPTPRRLVFEAVRYGVGVLAIVWLVAQVDLARLETLLSSLDARTIGGLVGATVVGLLARFYTWHVLVNRVTHAKFRAAAGIDLVVNFVNQLLPSRVSGRAAAPLVLRTRTGMGYAAAVAVTGVHTGLYAVLYGAGSLVGVGFGIGRLSTGLLVLLALTTGLYLAVGGFVLLAGANLPIADRFVATLRRAPWLGDRIAGRVDNAPDFTKDSSGWFRRLSTDPRVVGPYAAALAVTLLVAPGVRVWLLLSSFGTAIEPATLLPFYILLAYGVTLLPLTPGGIGVTEATATAVFVSLGVPAAVIVPVVFLDRTLGVYLPAIAGWYPSMGLDVWRTVTD